MSLLTPNRILKFLSISIRVVFNLAGSGGALIGTPKSSSAVRLFHKEESHDLGGKRGGQGGREGGKGGGEGEGKRDREYSRCNNMFTPVVVHLLVSMATWAWLFC